MKEQKIFYGWKVVAAFFIIGATLYGIQFFFGVFFKSIESEFDLTRTTTSAILSANLLLTGFFGFLGGWALDKYGPRIVTLLMGLITGLSLVLTSQVDSLWQLFFTYSLLVAIGTGPVYSVPMSTASRWFEKKRGLALGITSAGAGFGTLLMAPFSTYLVFRFGWRTALLIIGVITWLIIIPLCKMLKKDPHEIGALPDGVIADTISAPIPTPNQKENNLQPTELTLLQVCKTKNFWIFNFIWMSFAFSIFLVLTHIVPHITDIGFSAGEAAAILSMTGGASIIGRIITGVASDRIGHKFMATTCLLVQVGAMVWLIWARELWMFYTFAIFFGIAYGGIAPSMGAFTSVIFKLKNIGAMLGATTAGFALGGAIGPAIGGYIFDVTGSYSLAFSIGASIMFLATLSMFLIREKTQTLPHH